MAQSLPYPYQTRSTPSGVDESAARVPGIVTQFLVLTLLLGLAYSSTIFLEYALNDENWIIRASDWWLRFDVRQGRPLFSLAIYLTSRLHDLFGFHVIALLRAGGIVGLAFAMAFLSVWLQRWGASKIHALITCLAVATLPPFQIYIANATWVVIPFTVTIVATLLLSHGYHDAGTARRRGLCYLGSGMLILGSLAFYQPAILIGLAMFIVPTLAMPVRETGETRKVARFVAFGAAFFAVVTLLYYVAWFLLWRWLERQSAGGYYSPTFVNIDPVGRLHYFFRDRLIQATNLWYVDSLKASVWSYLTISLIGIGAIADLIEASKGSDVGEHLANLLTKYICAFAFVVLSDAIPLLAGAPIPSYVTAPALFFAVAIWASHGVYASVGGREPAMRLVGAGLAAFAAVGLFMAQYTIVTYFAVPQFLEYALIQGEARAYLKSHQSIQHVHVVGRKDSLLNHGLHEFGWSNSTFDVYVRDMVKNVLDEVGVPSEVEVTASDTLVSALPKTSVPPPGSALIIDLSRIHLR
ncbi:MAG TPA: hypothetical protein VNZ26_10310 [Vicinamibacterales bacterium]|nr:hypothetical protein [Vicinamibacterales bacterium]